METLTLTFFYYYYWNTEYFFVVFNIIYFCIIYKFDVEISLKNHTIPSSRSLNRNRSPYLWKALIFATVPH